MIFETVVLLAIIAAVLIAINSEKCQPLVVTIIAGAMSKHLEDFLASAPVKDLLNKLLHLACEMTIVLEQAFACALCMLSGCTSCETVCGFQNWTFLI